MSTSSSVSQKIHPSTPHIIKNQPLLQKDAFLKPKSTSLRKEIPPSEFRSTVYNFNNKENQVNEYQPKENQGVSRVLPQLWKNLEKSIEQDKKDKELTLKISKTNVQDQRSSSTKKAPVKQGINKEATVVKGKRDFLCVRKKMLSNIENQIPKVLPNSSNKIQKMLAGQNNQMKGERKIVLDGKSGFPKDKGSDFDNGTTTNDSKPFNNLTDRFLAQTMISPQTNENKKNDSEFGHDKLLNSLDHVLENTALDVKINFQKTDQSQDVCDSNPLRQMFKGYSRVEKEYGFLDLDFLDNDEIKKEAGVEETTQADIDENMRASNLIDGSMQVSEKKHVEKDVQTQEEDKEVRINVEFPGIDELSQKLKRLVEEEKEALKPQVDISIVKCLESLDRDNLEEENIVEPKDMKEQEVFENKKEESEKSNITNDLELKNAHMQRTNKFQTNSWPPKELKSNDDEPQEPQSNKMVINVDKDETIEAAAKLEVQIQDNNNLAGKKYSVYEDWRIIQSLEAYRQENSEVSLMTNKVWKQLTDPLTGKKVLSDVRTRGSVEIRSRSYLSSLKTDEIERIQNFIREHSEEEAKRHCIKFKMDKVTKERKLFDIVKMEEKTDQKKKSKKKEKPGKRSRENKKRKEPSQGNLIKNPQNLLKRIKHEDLCHDKLPKFHISIGQNPGNAVQENIFICVDLENDSRKFVRDEQKKQREAKEFSGDILQELSVLSEKYKISINKLNVLLGQVSYSFEDLEKYLQTQQPMILWTAQEDQDVMEGNEVALRYLKMIKGEQSVERRRKYLIDF